MIFEIINPSDPYTLKGDDFAICCAACLMLGMGKYALQQTDAEDVQALHMPLFLFDGDAAVPWFREKFDADLGKFIEANMARIADCLDTIVIGGPEVRADYERGLQLIDDPAKRKIWSEEWLDRRRSSLNNIGRSAERNAAHLRAALEKLKGAARGEA